MNIKLKSTNSRRSEALVLSPVLVGQPCAEARAGLLRRVLWLQTVPLPLTPSVTLTESVSPRPPSRRNDTLRSGCEAVGNKPPRGARRRVSAKYMSAQWYVYEVGGMSASREPALLPAAGPPQSGTDIRTSALTHHAAVLGRGGGGGGICFSLSLLISSPPEWSPYGFCGLTMVSPEEGLLPPQRIS